ncbi:hypothetical protein TREES_T100017691 [Tupaia chinensis]|uniref:Uncharacterized protein n=1 Tax=Tupaia chinensis TaxID=246437 RepID=L9KYB0_TUPCH|nr:hypothetical protein TREES_T100017691 [Tupaia chinensis]
MTIYEVTCSREREPLLLLPKEAELDIDVVEVPPQGSSGALHNDGASPQDDVYVLGNVDRMVAENGLHPAGVPRDDGFRCLE